MQVKEPRKDSLNYLLSNTFSCRLNHGAMVYAVSSGLDIYLETFDMQLPSHKINQWHAYEIHQQACEALISKYSRMF